MGAPGGLYRPTPRGYNGNLAGHGAQPSVSTLADLLGETRISDEPASDAGTDYPESRLVSLLD